MPPGHNAEKSGGLANLSSRPKSSLGRKKKNRAKEKVKGKRELTLSLPSPSAVENLRGGQTLLAINKLRALCEQGGPRLYGDRK